MQNKTLSNIAADRPLLIDELGGALSELLQELFVQRKDRWENKDLARTLEALRPMDIAEMLESEPPGDAEIFLSRLTAHSLIEGALIVSIIEIGRHLDKLGGVELMQDVAEKACQMPLKAFGHTTPGSDFQRQMTVVDSNWNNIGNWFS